MMKIEFFSADNNYSSGAFKSMARLAKGLIDNGYEIKIVLPQNGDGERLLKEYSIPYVVISSNSWIVPKNKLRLLARIKTIIGMVKNCLVVEKKIENEIESYEPDFVHINGSWTYCGAKVANKLGIPVIWHIREFLEEDQNRKIVFKKWGYKLIDKSEMVICISQSIYRKYRDILEKANIVVIPNGINIAEYYQSKHELFKTERTKLLIVGGISRNKGQYIALKNFSQLENTNAELHIVGGASGINKYLFKYYLRKYNSSKIIYHGRQYEVSKFYRDADIFLMTSKYEAWGRVTAEAMAAGCLVIGANGGATPELVENGTTGFLFDYCKKGDLLYKIRYAIDNKELSSKLAIQGQQKAIEEYTCEKNLALILNQYRAMKK